jgi:HAD superfamily hydrolase (TIGR01509 family)
VFDMDGVLFLSSEAHMEAYAKVCAEIGVPCPDYRTLAGMRTDQAIQKLLAQAGRTANGDELEHWVARKRAHARERLHARPPIDPHTTSTIKKLQQGGALLALASSSSRENVELFLSAAGLTQAFRAVLSGDDLSQGKPDPEIYLRACEALRRPPAECWAVEDSAQGIRSARAAGLRVIGRTGALDAAELRAAGATATIDSLLELPELLRGLGT